ncbi:hypothetical protein MOQ_009486 [Trypanosoma cruzi marinkellei]|uniref:Uncharacterized protein n=1 Tax=Trypanosoma cruzi marinkellei TaxID=85056 RepID=K2MWP5_TRYCR|nr:hypothetical protein MOQ_009486 [Trypanosoma cruzi marinkellei]
MDAEVEETERQTSAVVSPVDKEERQYAVESEADDDPVAIKAKLNATDSNNVPPCEEYPTETPKYSANNKNKNNTNNNRSGSDSSSSRRRRRRRRRNGGGKKKAAEEYPIEKEEEEEEEEVEREGGGTSPQRLKGTNLHLTTSPRKEWKGDARPVKKMESSQKNPRMSPQNVYSAPTISVLRSPEKLTQLYGKVSPTARQKRGPQQQPQQQQQQQQQRLAYVLSMGKNEEDASQTSRGEESGRRGKVRTRTSPDHYKTVYMKTSRTPRRQQTLRPINLDNERGKTLLQEAAQAYNRKADDLPREDEYPVEETQNERVPLLGHTHKSDNNMESDSGEAKVKWIPFSRGVNHLSSMSMVNASSVKKDFIEDNVPSRNECQRRISSQRLLQTRRQNDDFQRCLHELIDLCNSRSEKDMVTSLGFSYACILAGKRRHMLSEMPEVWFMSRRALLLPQHCEVAEQAQETAQFPQRYSNRQHESSAALAENVSGMKKSGGSHDAKGNGLQSVRPVQHEGQDPFAELELDTCEQGRNTDGYKNLESTEELDDVHCEDEKHQELLAG